MSLTIVLANDYIENRLLAAQSLIFYYFIIKEFIAYHHFECQC